MKTWQVGVLTFLVCSLIFTPVGIIAILVILHRRKKRMSKYYHPDSEKLRNEYKSLWDKMA